MPSKSWDTLQEVSANLHKIKSALGDYYNGRSGPVFGRGTGDWVELRKVKLEGGIPYGYSVDDCWFILRAVRVGT